MAYIQHSRKLVDSKVRCIKELVGVYTGNLTEIVC